MSRILVFLSICLSVFSINSWGQTTNEGQPKSWTVKTPLPATDYHLMPTFDLDKQLKTDAINEASGQKLWRFGYEHTVNYGLNNGGVWANLPNGDRIWRIEFESQGALSMNLIFDEFELPEGATVYLYNPKTNEYRGAYTSKNNNADRILGTTLVQGDDLVVEYYEPKAVKGQGYLNIGMVVHGYRSFGSYPIEKAIKGLNDAGNCNIDVKCPLGIGWEDQINSVAIIIVGGSGGCTGALINNTTNDGTPYFLTANHCGTNGVGAWVFRFNWDSPVAVCAQTTNSQDPGGPYNEVNGSVLRANNGDSDFSLLELNSAPTGDVYYAGWDRSTTPPTQTTGIHHPRGDVKKICRDDDPSTAVNWSGAAVWEVADWDQGVTEPGSSGSPLFNQNGLIIGQLYGGSAACNGTNDNNQDDNYGRIDASWDGTSASVRLKDWLDPTNSGATSVNGYNPNGPGVALDAGVSQIGGIQENYCNVNTFDPEITLRNYGNDTITTVDILYNVDGGANSTYTWNGTLNANDVTTVTLPTITATAGAHIFNVSTTLPNGLVDSNAVNDSRSFSFFITLGGQLINYALSTDCYASETSWTLSDSATGVVLYSGGQYSNNSSPDTLLNEFCLADGCYKFTIYDSYGDGLDGTAAWNCNLRGDYWITDTQGNELVRMTAPDANFGDSAVHHFCIPVVINNTTTVGMGQDKIDVYPNPTNNQAFVKVVLQKEQTIDLELYSATGQRLMARTEPSMLKGQLEVNLKDYPVGVYFIKVRVGDQIHARKLIKQ